MGKSLKGNECGKGIYLRENGKYSARFNAKDGSHREESGCVPYGTPMQQG